MIQARVMAVAALALAALVYVPAAAQEKYRLEGDEWRKLAGADPASPEGQLQAIRTAIAEDRPADAIKMADKWIEQNAGHNLMADAYLLRADAKVARKDYYKALFDYEFMIRAFPGSDQFKTGLEREFEIANLFAGGMKRKWLGMRILPAWGEAEELYIRIQERAPGSDIGERASLALGDFYFGRGEMNSATDAYDLFLVNYPRSTHREAVMLRLIESGLATFKGPVYDPTGLLNAKERIRQYQKEFPAAAEQMGADAVLVRIDESLAQKDLSTARWYHGQRRMVAAAYLYQRVAADHSGTAAAQQATERLAQLDPKLVAEAAQTMGGSREAMP